MGGDWMSTVNSPHHFYVQRSVTKNGVLQLKYLQGPVGYWNSLFQWVQGLSITETPLFYILVNEKNHCKLKMTQCFLPENASGILFLFYILFTAFQETMNQSHYSNNKYFLYNIKFKPSPFTQLICPSMSNHSEFSNSKWDVIYRYISISTEVKIIRTITKLECVLTMTWQLPPGQQQI